MISKCSRIEYVPYQPAIRCNAIQVIRLLLQFGSEVNCQDLQGRTPLMLAAQTNDSVLMQLILFAGADPTLQDVAGKTYVDYVSLQLKDETQPNLNF